MTIGGKDRRSGRPLGEPLLLFFLCFHFRFLMCFFFNCFFGFFLVFSSSHFSEFFIFSVFLVFSFFHFPFFNISTLVHFSFFFIFQKDSIFFNLPLFAVRCMASWTCLFVHVLFTRTVLEPTGFTITQDHGRLQMHMTKKTEREDQTLHV